MRKKWTRRWLVKVLLSTVILHLFLVLFGAFLIAFPNALKVFKKYGFPEDYGLTAETLHTRVGEAWLIRNMASRRVVLLCHGRSRNRSYLLSLARSLAGRFNVAIFDFRSHGQHSFGTCTIGLEEAESVGHMLDALEAEGFSDIVVYGASMGGAAAVLELAAHPRTSVSGLILNGVFADLHELLVQRVRGSVIVPAYLVELIIDVGGAWAGFIPGDVLPGSAIRHVRLPILVLQAWNDELLPRSSGETLSANAGGIATLCMYAGKHDMAENVAVQKMTRSFVETLNPECSDQ